MSVAEAIARYRNNPNVVYAEPDYEVQAVDTIPNDPFWANQWDMGKIKAPTVWDTQKDASDIVVAIVDTGISYTHPDLQPNIWTDTATGTYTGSPGAHGFTCMGSCFAGGADDFGHGTHVAGTIGAVGNNGVGIAGINWGVKMISFKFLDANGGGFISDAVLAFNKIAFLKNNGVNIRVTNNSWGGGGFDQALKDAMAFVESMDILDVCAAGNSGVNADATPMYPAAYDNRGILSVAASDSNDVAAFFTNIGLASVDIAAPGVSIYSTVPTGSCRLCSPSGYAFLDGTSMATPHVAGVAAALAHATAAKADKIRDAILDPSSYDALTDSRLQATSTVGGRLNFLKALNNALNNPALAPGTPLNSFPVMSPVSDVAANAQQLITLNATASDSDPVTIGWTALTSGSAIYGAMLNNIFPTPALNTNPFSFTAASVARTAYAKYVASVADRRGGSAQAPANVQISPSSPHGQPTGSFSLATHSIDVNGTVTLNFNNLVDPDGQQPIYWQAWFLSDTVWGEMCCLSSTNPSFDLQMSNAGAYRVTVQAINKALNLSPKYSDVLSVGGVTGTPPIASALVNNLEGAAPLTVTIDMSASSTPGGNPITSYGFYCFDGLRTSAAPTGSCTYNDPGTYYLWTTVKDSKGLMDAAKTYITVLPSSAPPPPPAPDFSISATPASQTVTVGASTSYATTVSAVNGFGATVNLSVSGLPSGAGGSFTPPSVTGSGQSTLSITTTPTILPGTYPLTITGTSGSLTHSRSVTLVVTAPPAPPGDFSLAVSSTNLTVKRAGSTSTTVTVTALNGFNSTVTLTVTGLPNGSTAKFTPPSVTGSGTSTLSINTAKGAKAATYTLTITGTSAGISHTASKTLTVTN